MLTLEEKIANKRDLGYHKQIIFKASTEVTAIDQDESRVLTVNNNLHRAVETFVYIFVYVWFPITTWSLSNPVH